MESQYIHGEEEWAKLQGLGFSTNSRRTAATAWIKANKNEFTEKLITLISILYFEVFSLNSNENETFIEVIPKKTGQRK